MTARQALAHPYWRTFDPRPPSSGVIFPHFPLNPHLNHNARGACAAFQAAVKAAQEASRHFTTREQARASAVALSTMAQNLTAAPRTSTAAATVASVACAAEAPTVAPAAVGAVWQHATIVEDAIRELEGAARAKQQQEQQDIIESGSRNNHHHHHHHYSDHGRYAVPMEGGAAQLGVGSVVLERSRLARSLKTLLLAKPVLPAPSPEVCGQDRAGCSPSKGVEISAPSPEIVADSAGEGMQVPRHRKAEECPRAFAVQALQRFCALAALPEPSHPQTPQSSSRSAVTAAAATATYTLAPEQAATAQFGPAVSELAPLSDPEPQSPVSPPSLARTRNVAGADALLSSCSSSSSSSSLSSSLHATAFPSSEFPATNVSSAAARAAAFLPKRLDSLYPDGPGADITFAVEAPADYDHHNDCFGVSGSVPTGNGLGSSFYDNGASYFAQPSVPSTPPPKILLPGAFPPPRVEYARAHRSVLLDVPSLVLATNMTHDTRDTTQGQVVKVLGCRPDSFRALLHFLYFGALPAAAVINTTATTTDGAGSAATTTTTKSFEDPSLSSSLAVSGECAAGLVELAERFMVPSLHAPAARALRTSLETLAPLSTMTSTTLTSSISLPLLQVPHSTKSGDEATTQSRVDSGAAAAAAQTAALARDQFWRVLECAAGLQFNESAQAALLKVAGQWLAPRLHDPNLALLEDPRTLDNFQVVVDLVVDQTLALLADRGVGFYDLSVLFPDDAPVAALMGNGAEVRISRKKEAAMDASPSSLHSAGAAAASAAVASGWATPSCSLSSALKFPMPQPYGLLEDDVARLGRTAQWGSLQNSSSNRSDSSSGINSSGSSSSFGSSCSNSSSDASMHPLSVPCPWGSRGVGRSVGRADGAALAVYMWRARSASRQAQPPVHFLERLAGRARHRSAQLHEEVQLDAARAAANASAALSLFASPPRRTRAGAAAASSNGHRTAAGGAAAAAGGRGGTAPGEPPNPPPPPPPSAGLLTPPQPPPDFSFAPTSSQRVILLDWHTEVAEEYHISTEGLHLAARLLDRALVALPHVARNTFQLLGCACMLAAAKLTENDPIDLNDFVYICDNT